MAPAPETLAKADPELRRALAAAAPDTVLPTMVTLAPAAAASPAEGEGRERWASAQEAAFASEVGGLLADLRAHGARDLKLLWIARSLSGELPVEAIDAAARHPEVVRLALVVQRNVLL